MMNDGSTHNKQYHAAEIRSYLTGQMRPEEMHALEKAALDDPFLEEAIEGMREALAQHGAEKVMAPLADLKAAIAERSNPPKIVPFFQRKLFRMAAAAVLILVAGTWIYTNLSSKEKNDTLAVQPGTAEQPAAGAAIDPSTDSLPAAAPSAAPDNKDSRTALKPVEPVYPARVLKNVPVKAHSMAKAPVVAPAAPVFAQDSTNQLSKPVEEKVADDLAKADRLEKEAALNKDRSAAIKEEETKSRMMNMANNYFKGKVVDPLNNPLANVSITPLNSQQTFLTDKDGLFQIPVADTQVTVMVSTVGYTTRNFQLNNQGFMNQLSLEPVKNNLSEVVITQPSRKKDSYLKKAPAVLVQTATPDGGWVAFENYVEANNKLKGQKQVQVVVSFAIDRKNELSDFRIEQSGGAAQDAEAIRLIKEGPAWKLNKSRKDRVMVIIRF